MSETAGSCGVECQRVVARDFNFLGNGAQQCLNYKMNEPAQKNREFRLSNSDKPELISFKAGKVLDWFNNSGNGTICYSA